MPANCVYQHVNLWQRKAVLWACFIQIYKVDVDLPLAILFMHHHNIGKLIWVVDFPDKTVSLNFLHLLINDPTLFGGKLPSLLSDRRIVWIHFQLMSNNF